MPNNIFTPHILDIILPGCTLKESKGHTNDLLGIPSETKAFAGASDSAMSDAGGSNGAQKQITEIISKQKKDPADEAMADEDAN